MISEGSCDTEDWSNDAEKLAKFIILYYIIYYIILFYIQIENFFICNIIF